jgi:fused signal recognition particle receptor
MVFNWFRRKFDKAESDSELTSDPEQLAESGGEDVEAEAEADLPEPASPEVATDYLAWAKAAYQNIQQQQAATTPEVVPDEPIAEPVVTDRESQPDEPVVADDAPTPTLVENESIEPFAIHKQVQKIFPSGRETTARSG